MDVLLGFWTSGWQFLELK